MNPDFVTRTARVLTAKGLSLAEHQVMCSAGYRVTLPPLEFVEHAFKPGKATRAASLPVRNYLLRSSISKHAGLWCV